MKSIKPVAVLTGLVIFIVACNPFDRSARSFMRISFPGNEQRFIVKSDHMSIDIRYSGDIVFNEEETAIEKMSPGAYLDYRRDDKRLVAEPAEGGDVVYKFYNDADYEVGDGNGKKFLEEAIAEMISQGMFLEGRMERSYQEGGVPLLLKDLRKAKSDIVIGKYVAFILQSDSVSQAQMTEISHVIANRMSSDDDKRRILEKVPTRYLQDTLIAEAYFAAIQSIHSDNAKTNALRKTLKGPLSVPAFTLLLTAANTINSDNDKANLLKELIRNESLEKEVYDTLLNAIGTINDDNDKADVLKVLIDKQIYSGEPFRNLLAVMCKINSDHDKANVLKKLAEQPISTDEDWVQLINGSSSVSSDNDKANVLLTVSKKMPRSEQVMAAYMMSAKTIHSEQDYKRTVKPVQ